MSSHVPSANVAVVTATIGHRSLARAIRSVRAQTHSALTHWLVVDGPEFEASVRGSLAEVGASEHEERLRFLVLPERTGAGGWCSHRVYAAMPWLINADYVCYLDQDNWYEADHVECLLAAALAHGSPCAFSLRAIYDRSGRYVCNDDCQSLGTLHDSYDTPGLRHVDTSCWLIQRELSIRTAASWNAPYVGDRAAARELMKLHPDMPCTGKYSLNYTVSSRVESAPAEYFLRGNALMKRRYPDALPWARRAAAENARV